MDFQWDSRPDPVLFPGDKKNITFIKKTSAIRKFMKNWPREVLTEALQLFVKGITLKILMMLSNVGLKYAPK